VGPLNPRFGRLLERVDPFDPEFVAHFFDVCSEIREHCPVVHSEALGEFWTVARFDDVMNGFNDNDALSPIPTATIPPNPGAVPLPPLQAGPDDHRELRRLLNPYFRSAALAGLEPGIRAVVTRLLDDFIERGRCEFVHEFAQRLPGEVIFRQLLGLPDSEVGEAYHWTLAIMHGHDTDEVDVIYQRFTELAASLLERRRREARQDDIVDALLYGLMSGRPLTDDEILRTVMLLIAGGLDTTAHALSNSIVRFAGDPALRDRLEAAPERIPDAIEELLRIDPPAGGLVRTAMRDTRIGDERIRAGERVLLLVAGANRDPREFDHPDDVDLERATNRHLSWGYGAHYCLGVHLARLELRIALEEILRRIKDIRLTDARVAYDTGCSRGPMVLNIAFTPGVRLAALPTT
jgi:cytochrome P450